MLETQIPNCTWNTCNVCFTFNFWANMHFNSLPTVSVIFHHQVSLNSLWNEWPFRVISAGSNCSKRQLIFEIYHVSHLGRSYCSIFTNLWGQVDWFQNFLEAECWVGVSFYPSSLASCKEYKFQALPWEVIVTEINTDVTLCKDNSGKQVQL